MSETMSNTDMTATGYDYETAQTLRVKGLSYKEISKKLNIPFEGLLKYGKRHKWDIIRTKAVEIVSDKVQTDMATRAVKHVHRIADLADKAIENVIAKDLASLDIDSLSKLANIANTFDLIGRRAYRLDEQQSRVSNLLTLNITSDGSSVKLANIVDVDTVVSDADSQICENSQH